MLSVALGRAFGPAAQSANARVPWTAAARRIIASGLPHAADASFRFERGSKLPHATSVKCSVCGSDRIVPSHRRGVERLARYVFPLAPYRCTECWGRLWCFERPIRIAAAKAVVLLGVLALIALAHRGLWHLLPEDPSSPQAVHDRQEVDTRPTAGPGHPR